MPHRCPKDRNESIKWARDLLSCPNDWVIMDAETTGKNKKKTDEIVQIGILAPDGSVLLDSLVRPVRRKRMPRDAFAKHGITMKMLADAPTYSELAETVVGILDAKERVIAYNAEYDEQMLRQTAEWNAEPVPLCWWDCAMCKYAQFVGEWAEWKNDYKWQKLPSVEHNAIGDCRATLKLIRMMAATPMAAIPIAPTPFEGSPRRWWQFWRRS